MKKKGAGEMFLAMFLRTLILLVLLLGVGFISYKVVLTHYTKQNKSEESTKVPRQEDDEDSHIKDMVVTAIYGDDTTTQSIDYMLVKLFNVNTKNEDYITIPTNTKVTLSKELYEILSSKASEIPEEILVSEVATYFSNDVERYEMTNKVLQELLGIDAIDYYEAVNQESFVSIINLVSPIEFNVPVAMKFKDTNGINVELGAGLQTINGDQALGLLRNTEGYADGELGRVSTGNSYLKKYVDAVHSFASVDDLSDYITKYYSYVTTNSSDEIALQYLQYYYESKSQQVKFTTLEGSQESDVYQVDPTACAAQVKALIDNTTAYEEQQGGTTDEETSTQTQVTSSKGLSIAVYNSTRTNGLAGKWKEKLVGEGYTVNRIETDRSGALDNTKILVRSEGVGQDLLTYFPSAVIEVGEVDEGFDIKIIIGSSDIF